MNVSPKYILGYMKQSYQKKRFPLKGRFVHSLLSSEEEARSLCHVLQEDIHNFLFEQMTCVIGVKEISSNISFYRETIHIASF